MKSLLFKLLPLAVFLILVTNGNAQVISGGENHSLFLCSDGSGMAVGENYVGQFGDGTTISTGCGCDSIPGPVSIQTGITAVAGEGLHSLFLRNDGTVWAAGWNGDGQLGDGTTSDKSSPVRVDGLTDIIDVAAGFEHSLFLKDDGTVWAVGSNDEGELGIGSAGWGETSPVQVNWLTGIIDVAAGYHHSLFLKNDGTVWATGKNFYGQLGDGTTTDRSVPVQVSGLTDIIAIEGTDRHSLFLKNDGTVWAVGRNAFGQLGDGTNSDKSTPVQVSGLTGITKIGGGAFHSLFVKSDGTVWTVGRNDKGQLGDGTMNSRSIPVQVNGLTDITDATGGRHYSLFRKNDGTVWAVGQNNLSQLGIGTRNTTGCYCETTPMQVTNLCSVASPEPPHYVEGSLYDDTNNDCGKQSSESGLSNYLVKSSPDDHYTFTNDTGFYSLGVNDSVNYTVKPIIPQRFSHMVQNPCPTDYSVYLDANAPEDTSGFDFGFDYNPCHQLRVSVNSNRRRRCFTNKTTVYYTNEGLMPATSVLVHLNMPDHVIPISASMPYTWSSDSNMVFDIDTLEAGQSGTIEITDSVACVQGITGLSQCTEAWITPPNTCLMDSTTGPGWDSSSVMVEGACVNDTVRFIIHNTGDAGTGDMTDSSEYRVYMNNGLMQTGSFQIAGEDSLVIPVVSGGATIRLEADQQPGHPGYSQPRETIEACGTDSSGTFSVGMVSQAPKDDKDVHVEVDCLPIIDSYDPNDKQVAPSGVGKDNIVPPETLLDFTIRFQNTGTDTAYNVVVVDTLSSSLDISTLEPGPASSPYSMSLSGTGNPVLTFNFNNINLPDSATNKLGSMGFVKFKISPYDSVPIGTVIENFVDIYFDFNAPIRTNTTSVTIDTFTYTPDYLADIIAQPVIDSVYCTGDSVTFAPAFSGKDLDYQWYKNGQPMSGETDSILTIDPISATDTGDYFARVIGHLNSKTTDTIALTLGETSSTLFKTSCNSFSLNGQVYTASGIYSQLLPNSVGCDSTITLYLTINNGPDTSVTLSSNTLMADASGASYQWVDCNDNYSEIFGETGQSYTATTNGNYAVILNENGCTDTSSCNTISGVGIKEAKKENTLKIFPDPNNGSFTVTWEGMKVEEVQVLNTIGQILLSKQLNSTGLSGRLANLQLKGASKGTYLVKVIGQKRTEFKKVVLK